MTERACVNTDREIWREREGDYYADSIHVTQAGGIGIDCGGTVIVKPVREWHALATLTRPSSDEVTELVERLRTCREALFHADALALKPEKPTQVETTQITTRESGIIQDAMLDAIRALTQGDTNDTWQPIETAPKSEGDDWRGPRILLWQADAPEGHEVGVFFWHVDGWSGDDWEHSPALNPTHWRPLPAPPQATNGKDGG